MPSKEQREYNKNMNTVKYSNKEYQTDGEYLWIDGILQDVTMPKEVKNIKQIEVLKVDDLIYHNDTFYKAI